MKIYSLTFLLSVIGLISSCHSGGLLPPRIVMNKVMYINEARTKVIFEADVLVLLINFDNGNSWSTFRWGVNFGNPIYKSLLLKTFENIDTHHLYTMTSDKISIWEEHPRYPSIKYAMIFDWDNGIVDLEVDRGEIDFENPSGRYKIVTIRNDSPDSQWFMKYFRIHISKEWQEKLEEKEISPKELIQIRDSTIEKIHADLFDY